MKDNKKKIIILVLFAMIIFVGFKYNVLAENITINFGCPTDTESDEYKLMKTLKNVYNLFKYVTPAILIVLGSVDLFRATMAGNAEEIAKNKKRFFTRLGIAALILILSSLFELVVNLLSKAGVNNSGNWFSCFNSLVVLIK